MCCVDRMSDGGSINNDVVVMSVNRLGAVFEKRFLFRDQLGRVLIAT